MTRLDPNIMDVVMKNALFIWQLGRRATWYGQINRYDDIFTFNNSNLLCVGSVDDDELQSLRCIAGLAADGWEMMQQFVLAAKSAEWVNCKPPWGFSII